MKNILLLLVFIPCLLHAQTPKFLSTTSSGVSVITIGGIKFSLVPFSFDSTFLSNRINYKVDINQTANRVMVSNSSGVVSTDPNLYWTGSALGVGTNGAPAGALDVKFASGNNGFNLINASNTGSDYAVFRIIMAGAEKFVMYANSNNITASTGGTISTTASQHNFTGPIVTSAGFTAGTFIKTAAPSGGTAQPILIGSRGATGLQYASNGVVDTALSNIAGKATAGTGMARTGAGTSADPYVFSASGVVSAVALDWAATTAWDLNIGHSASETLFGNTILSVSNPVSTSYYDITLTQDATGSRLVTWPSSFKWPGGTPPTLSTAPGAVDIITCQYKGTVFNCNYQKDYK